MRCLEFYSGIGGFAVAAERLGWHVALAIDINQIAAEVYRCNFRHPVAVRTIESIPASELADLKADLWWMSPPCQPFTSRGRQRDLADPRTFSFLQLMERLQHLSPRLLALENVPAFACSKTADRLRGALSAAGYSWHECTLCPTEFGIPNRRQRFYLVAALSDSPRALNVKRLRLRSRLRIADLIQGEVEEGLNVARHQLDRYRQAMHIVDAEDDDAISSCFTSAYGRSFVRSGSFLRQYGRVRHFAPSEILRLLGFPDHYRIPVNINRQTAWKLAGNSVSIPVVEHLLRFLPAPVGADKVPG